MNLILDDDFYIESDTYSFVLRKEKKGEMNNITGKRIISSGAWHYPTINMCLKQYIQESLKSHNEASVILDKLLELEAKIDGLKLPTLYQIKSSEATAEKDMISG